jgi:acetyl esterase/lipase
VTDQVRYQTALFEHVHIQENIAFRAIQNDLGETEALSLDVYSPVGDLARHRPAILWIHGGGFRPGNDKRQRYIIHMSTEFAKRGYVCFAPDYRVRVNPDADCLGALRDAVEDCQAALQWIRDRHDAFGVDPSRIAVGGGSAGGVIGLSLCALENHEAAAQGRRGVFAFADLWGGPPQGMILAPLDDCLPPTVIVYGMSDTVYPFALGQGLAETLSRLGVHHLLYAIPGAPHTPMTHLPEIVETVVRFFYTAMEEGMRLWPTS